MKNKAMLLVLGFCASLLISATVVLNYEVKLATGEVEQVEGIYIFYRCKPVKEYEYIGTYKIKLTWTGQPEEMFNKLVKKSKEKYPNLQAIVIDDNMEKCDAIKFK